MVIFGRKRKPKLGPGKKLSASAWSGKSTSRRRSRRDKSEERCVVPVGSGAGSGSGAGPSWGGAWGWPQFLQMVAQTWA